MIPARYGSSRFPGKPLALIRGRPMILHVVDRVRQSALLNHVLVLTDDVRIQRVVEEAGVDARMTHPDHASGTDRMVEVLADLPQAEILVNIQGDEPLIEPRLIDRTVQQLLAAPDLDAATPVRRADSITEVEHPDNVKVVRDRDGMALYFSRSVIPYRRDGSLQLTDYWLHVGLYVYRRRLLEQFPGWTSSLEAIERLEQLRLLENAGRILTVEVPWKPIGVDRPEDLERVEQLLMNGTAKQPGTERL